MLTYLILAAFGVLSGVTTVLFGFGGGFVTVPLLFSVLTAARNGTGASAMHVAVATSTAVMVVSSLAATVRHARGGNLVAAELWPLLGFIAVGSGLGACFAVGAPDGLLRWAFVTYLGVTILDCLLRRGFLARTESAAPRRMPVPLAATAGIAIGAVATFLGVGGSVMTVPMMRRRGMDMTRATAMANPLTVPVALVGAGFYMLLPTTGAASSPRWQVGGVDGLAFAVLVAGSLLGIRAASPLIGRIPDDWHARAYLLLLAVVLLGMVA